MSINVFEGARRIAKLFALIWVVGCVIFFTIDISEMKPPINEAKYQLGTTQRLG